MGRVNRSVDKINKLTGELLKDKKLLSRRITQYTALLKKFDIEAYQIFISTHNKKILGLRLKEVEETLQKNLDHINQDDFIALIT